MKREIQAPTIGESITEVRVGQWKKQNGETVKSGEVLLEIESDKATVEVAADTTGVLSIVRQTGETVRIGDVIGVIDPMVGGQTGGGQAPAVGQGSGVGSAGGKSPGTPQTSNSGLTSSSASGSELSTGAAQGSAPELSGLGGQQASGTVQPSFGANVAISPAVRRLTTEQGIKPADVVGTGKDGRVTKADVIRHLGPGGPQSPGAGQPPAAPSGQLGQSSRERRVAMSLLRQRIAERLVSAQHTAAILTTFNECDMSKVMEIRARNKDSFKAKNGVPLSFMSFFTRACVEGLKAIPAVNAMLDGKDIIYRDYYDIGIAVGTERGLVVPVLRNMGDKNFVEIEKALAEMAIKAREGKLSIQDMTGGTFTISNGGVYGSLLSTPILNPPQSGILGMHKIQERPMAINGQVVIKPMMYLALSYDHRMIDGKEAVTFLIKVKEGIENPSLIGWEE